MPKGTATTDETVVDETVTTNESTTEETVQEEINTYDLDTSTLEALLQAQNETLAIMETSLENIAKINYVNGSLSGLSIGVMLALIFAFYVRH